MDIGFISHKLMEINMLKSAIFDERENMVFNYEKKRCINLSNADTTNDYIESLMESTNDEDFEIDEYVKIKNEEKTKKEKILGFMRNYY